MFIAYIVVTCLFICKKVDKKREEVELSLTLLASCKVFKMHSAFCSTPFSHRNDLLLLSVHYKLLYLQKEVEKKEREVSQLILPSENHY